MAYHPNHYTHLRDNILRAIGDRNPSELEAILSGLDSLRRVVLLNQITGAPSTFQRDKDVARITEKRRENAHQKEGIYVVMIDIDNFGQFNKTHGETVGNNVLRSVTEIITETLRDDDLVISMAKESYGYHLHGEEMLALYTCRSVEDAIYVAERLCRNVEQKTISSGHRVTISAGITQWNTNQESYQAAQDRADRCMQYAKREGKNRVYCPETDPLFSLKEKLYKPGTLDSMARSATEAVRSIKGIVGRTATAIYNRLFA